jgi:hypothetical protein
MGSGQEPRYAVSNVLTLPTSVGQHIDVLALAVDPT